MIGWHKATGVDLSGKMLEQAGHKGIYDSLQQSEIISFLTDTDETYHLMTAADVLTYFGDLRPLFEAVASKLELGGLFVFTVSENTISNTDYQLTPSGRFVHNTDYIMTLLKKVSFHINDHTYIRISFKDIM